MKRSVWFAFGYLILCLLASSLLAPPRSQAQGSDPLVLLKTIEVSGRPDAIVVDCYVGRNDIIFYDRSEYGRVRFIDGDTLTLVTDEIALPTGDWEGWMVYDREHQHTYVLSTRSRGTYPNTWNEAWVSIIGRRATLGGFSANESYNADPQKSLITHQRATLT
jgi:hypothetical protein